MNETDTDNITGLIFSKDRALQLQAAIESFFLHCRDPEKVRLHVLYAASNDHYRGQYESLRDKFGVVAFVEETAFKAQVVSLVGAARHVLFLVDDNLFVGDFSITEILDALRAHGDAIGFSLRLGRNTTYCYAHDTAQRRPIFQRLGERVLKYDWTSAEYDFGYPLELSSSVYRTADILQLLRSTEYNNPNTLEGAMAANAHVYRQERPSLLCFDRSVAFCVPVNMVQTVCKNRAACNWNYPAGQLAEAFDKGARIDVQRYSGFVPNACHQETELHLSYAGQRVASPKFSVVMANHNNGRYIGQAIESVLAQTFGDWELIIVDDGSTDDSLAVIERYLADGRIRLVRHQANRGYTPALKTGISNVRSKYFGILDSDDCLLPDALETMYRAHLEWPDRGLIYSQFAYCDAQLKRTRIGFCAPLPEGQSCLDANVVSHFKTFKMRDYLKTDGYDENILYAEDIDIVYKMEELSTPKFVNRCLYLHRQRPNSISRSANKINTAIMSRVKARINALKRRCVAAASRQKQDFWLLFGRAVAEARRKHDDVEQYFSIVARLYEKGMLAGADWPGGAENWDLEHAVLWLAANVDIDFEKLFSLIGRQGKPRRPLVTVEMAAYNAERYIGRAVESVLAQTYPEFELVIVDDGSTDRTAEIVGSYTDSRIRYIRTPHKNCAAARNRVVAEARGRYILCVDSDDFIEPHYLEGMLALAERHPQIDYFYPARLMLTGADGTPTGQHWEYADFSDNRLLPGFIFENGYGPIPNPGSLKSKSLFERVGGYDDVNSVEDFVFLCRNALQIRFMRVDNDAAYFYRQLAGGSSHNFKARDRVMADVLNYMVSAYPPELLCPRLAEIADAADRQRYYLEYLARTFYRHSKGPMVQCGDYFRRYGDYYRRRLERATEAKGAQDSATALLDGPVSGVQARL